VQTKETVLTQIPRSYTYRRINDGMSGICYKTSDGRLFKKYKYTIDYYKILKDIADNFRCNHLALPEEFIFLTSLSEENFIGYLRQLVSGDLFDELSDDINFTKFIKALILVEKEMIDNSKRGLVYLDMNGSNMFYTPQDEIKVIDHDLYDVSFEQSFKERAYYNLRELASTIASCFFSSRNYQDSRIKENVMKCTTHRNGILRPSELMIETSNILEESFEGSIITLGDFRKKLELTKEK
jgi:hypothetical protein